MISTESKEIKCVSQDKWVKTREAINWFAQFIDVDEVPNCNLENYDGDCPQGHIPYKKAISLRGFLVYVSRTHKEFVPYLKGLHLSIDS